MQEFTIPTLLCKDNVATILKTHGPAMIKRNYFQKISFMHCHLKSNSRDFKVCIVKRLSLKQEFYKTFHVSCLKFKIL